MSAPIADRARRLALQPYTNDRVFDEQGANILLVSRVAGHARPSITLDVYSHLFEEGLAEAALRFDPLRSKAPIITALKRKVTCRSRRLVDGAPQRASQSLRLLQLVPLYFKSSNSRHA